MTSLPPVPPPPDPDDLASAVVDGLLTPAAAQQARQDPEVGRRIEQIEQMRLALRATPSPTPFGADSAVAAARAAFDAEAHASRRPLLHAVPAATVGGPASGMPRPPGPSTGRSHRAGWLAAAAAVLVVMGLAAVGLFRQSDTSSETATDEAAEEDRAGPAGAESRTEEESSGDAATGDDGAASESTAGDEVTQEAPTAATAVVVDLGEVDSVEELASRVGDHLVRPVPQPDAELDEPSRFDDSTCPGLLATGDPDRGTSVLVADAILDGVPVRVHVYESGADPSQLVATDESCAVVVDQPLDRD